MPPFGPLSRRGLPLVLQVAVHLGQSLLLLRPVHLSWLASESLLRPVRWRGRGRLLHGSGGLRRRGGVRQHGHDVVKPGLGDPLQHVLQVAQGSVGEGDLHPVPLAPLGVLLRQGHAVLKCLLVRQELVHGPGAQVEGEGAEPVEVLLSHHGHAARRGILLVQQAVVAEVSRPLVVSQIVSRGGVEEATKVEHLQELLDGLLHLRARVLAGTRPLLLGGLLLLLLLLVLLRPLPPPLSLPFRPPQLPLPLLVLGLELLLHRLLQPLHFLDHAQRQRLAPDRLLLLLVDRFPFADFLLDLLHVTQLRQATTNQALRQTQKNHSNQQKKTRTKQGIVDHRRPRDHLGHPQWWFGSLPFPSPRPLTHSLTFFLRALSLLENTDETEFS
mmetsp:Transcript_235/g.542  ORF Transcript_235/g.542 Transcript_235/m.542 type:complete len:385 (+) Transcript_235:1802-2956(+)